jgi:hypothetical protein
MDLLLGYIKRLDKAIGGLQEATRIDVANLGRDPAGRGHRGSRGPCRDGVIRARSRREPTA